jgi:membrane-bound serine protease (ClpP class)
MDLSASVALSVVGVILIAVDFYIPGFFLTAIGVILMIVADVVCALNQSLTVTLSLICAQVIVAGAAAWCSVNYFPRSKLGQRMMLDSSLAQAHASRRAEADLLGREGVAQTVLRPSGICQIDGQRIDAVAESAMIERGSRIKVIAVERNRILVRKL